MHLFVETPRFSLRVVHQVLLLAGVDVFAARVAAARSRVSGVVHVGAVAAGERLFVVDASVEERAGESFVGAV